MKWDVWVAMEKARRCWDRYRLGHRPVIFRTGYADKAPVRGGSMYSQAHASPMWKYQGALGRVWLGTKAGHEKWEAPSPEVVGLA